MRVQMKARTRRSHSIQRWLKRRRNLPHRGERKLKQFREPWMKRMREWEQLSPDKVQAERRKIGLNGPEVQFFPVLSPPDLLQIEHLVLLHVTVYLDLFCLV